MVLYPMAWICKKCGTVNMDASYRCVECSELKPSQSSSEEEKGKL